MLTFLCSSTLVEAVKSSNLATSDQSPCSFYRKHLYNSSDPLNHSSRPSVDPPCAPPIPFNCFRRLVTPQARSNEILASSTSNSHPVIAILARITPTTSFELPPPPDVLLVKMCHIENVHFSCGHPEDTKYTMCELAMSEMNHVTTTTETTKTYPCAACFARGVEEKAKQTREQQGRRR